MPQTIVHLHSQYRIGAVDPRLFGGFLEHMGRAVYEGVYQPDHPRADTDGFRTDVLDALRPLRMTAMRYPGAWNRCRRPMGRSTSKSRPCPTVR